MPTVVHWPGRVEPGTSAALVSQVDFYASLASLLDIELSPQEAMDSLNLLGALLGTTDQGRDYLIEESVATLSLRKANWKYIVPYPEDKIYPDWVQIDKGIEGGFIKEPQLYNLDNDAGEQNNLAKDYPALVNELQTKIEELRRAGFSERH